MKLTIEVSGNRACGKTVIISVIIDALKANGYEINPEQMNYLSHGGYTSEVLCIDVQHDGEQFYDDKGEKLETND